MQSDLYTSLNPALQDKNILSGDFPKGNHPDKDSKKPGLVVFWIGIQLRQPLNSLYY